MADEEKNSKQTNSQNQSPATDALCSEAPDKEKCEEFVEKRLGEANDNINPRP